VSATVPERVVSPKAPDPLGAYAHAVRAAGLVFCSGQGARDPTTGREAGITTDAEGRVTAYDIRVQTDAALRNIAGVLEDAVCQPGRGGESANLPWIDANLLLLANALTSLTTSAPGSPVKTRARSDRSHPHVNPPQGART
jgi:hypothetical protein